MTDDEFNPKLINFKFNLADAKYELDALQEEMLRFYLQSDRRFKRAFYTNFTGAFLKFIEDKVRLNEPISISIMGGVRTGKSSIGLSIGVYHQAIQGRLFTIDYVNANEFEYLEKVKSMPEEKLNGRIFINDEQKNTVYGVASIAKRMKLQDVSNIIAKANISVINICPTRFPAQDTAWYGLRTFGRCFKTHTVRAMIYNLQEGNSTLPLGIIYLPIYDYFLPPEFAEPLKKAYLEKKDRWIVQERSGNADVMQELRQKLAHTFARDEQYKELTNKDQRIAYVTAKLGSEYTRGEILEIVTLTQMIANGINIPSANE